MERFQDDAKCPTVADRDLAITTAGDIKEKIQEIGNQQMHFSSLIFQ